MMMMMWPANAWRPMRLHGARTRLHGVLIWVPFSYLTVNGGPNLIPHAAFLGRHAEPGWGARAHVCQKTKHKVQKTQ